MSKKEQLTKTEQNIPEFEPTEIVPISVGDLTVPVNTATELSKLFLYEKSILNDLFQDLERDEESGKLIVPPAALHWAKELRMLAKDIHDMTSGIQQEAAKKKIDILGEIYKSAIKNMEDKEQIELIRALENGDKIEFSKS